MAYPHVITMIADGGESLAGLKVPHSSVSEWWRRRGALVQITVMTTHQNRNLPVCRTVQVSG